MGKRRLLGFDGSRGGGLWNPMGFLMYDYPIETVEYIWMNIWCMLDWILSQNCRNTLPFHEKNETLLWLL